MKKDQHVIASHNGRWAVSATGASKASRVFDSQDEAVSHARELAQKAKRNLFVHGRDGMIREHQSYGNAPEPTKVAR